MPVRYYCDCADKSICGCILNTYLLHFPFALPVRARPEAPTLCRSHTLAGCLLLGSHQLLWVLDVCTLLLVLQPPGMGEQMRSVVNSANPEYVAPYPFHVTERCCPGRVVSTFPTTSSLLICLPVRAYTQLSSAGSLRPSATRASVRSVATRRPMVKTRTQQL